MYMWYMYVHIVHVCTCMSLYYMCEYVYVGTYACVHCIVNTDCAVSVGTRSGPVSHRAHQQSSTAAPGQRERLLGHGGPAPGLQRRGQPGRLPREHGSLAGLSQRTRRHRRETDRKVSKTDSVSEIV